MNLKDNSHMTDINLSQVNTKITLSKQWLYDTFLEKGGACGWSTFEGRNIISEWGGTLDAIRALLIVDESSSNIKIVQSINWLKSKQQNDGGWKSWEINNSIVEATSWALLTFQAANDSEKSSELLNGYEFLIKCQNTDGGWGSYEKDKSRTYPTLLAVWALSKSNRKSASKGSIWLIDAVNNDGGWGFHSKCQSSNAAMTPLVLYVLLINSYSIDAPIKSRAVKWIFQHKQNDNLWEAIIEDWNCFVDERTGREFPCRTDHFSTSWAILALLEAGVSVYDKRLYDSIISFINSQMSDGSWVFLNYDTKKYTWVVSNGLHTLNKIRDSLLLSTPIRQFDLLQILKQSTVVRCLLVIFLSNIIATAILLERIFNIFSNGIRIFLNILNYLLQNTASIFYFGKVEAGQILVAIIGTVLGGMLLHKLVTKKEKQ